MVIPFYCCAQAAAKPAVVDYGHVTTEWVYKNEGFNITLPLPKGAYFMNALSKPPVYVRIGSPVSHIEGYAKAVKVPVAEFNEVHKSSIATLFSFSYLPKDTAAIVKKPLDFNADKTFYFGLTNTDEKSVRDFLRQTCLLCTDEGFKEIYFPNVAIGNTYFDGYITGVRDLKGNKMGKFFGIKRVGDMYLVLQYYFETIEQYEEYKDVLKELRLN
jgi:hypothetical protein